MYYASSTSQFIIYFQKYLIDFKYQISTVTELYNFIVRSVELDFFMTIQFLYWEFLVNPKIRCKLNK